MVVHQIKIIQLNANKNAKAMEDILDTAIEMKVEIVCIQEPWLVDCPDGDWFSTRSLNHQSFTQLLPTTKSKPRVVMYIARSSTLAFNPSLDFPVDPDLQVYSFKTPVWDFNLFNLYNQKRKIPNSQPPRFTTTFQHNLYNQHITRPSIIVGDVNAHHPFWEPFVRSPNAEGLLLREWLEQENLFLHNDVEDRTFWRSNMESMSTLDLTISTPHFTNQIQDWQVLEEGGSESDHEAIMFTIAKANDLDVPTTIDPTRFDIKKADWTKFEQELKKGFEEAIYLTSDNFKELANKPEATLHLLHNPEPLKALLDSAAEEFNRIITKAAIAAIPLIPVSPKSKPWWTPELKVKKKAARDAFRALKKHLAEGGRDPEVREFAKQQRNIYLQTIKQAKTDHWNAFLEREDVQSIFKAMSYTKDRRTERIPQIVDLDGNLQDTFEGKCRAFKTTMYPPPPVAPEPRWEEHILKAWEWHKLTREEVEAACLSPKSTAPGPDQISSEIIAWAYKLFPEHFFDIYSVFINVGYHPLCWKQATGIILKKPKKPDYSQPKAYRVISLLNCLGKTSERIIATRLTILIETTDLIHPSQIGGRKHKSAIDATIVLTDYIQQERNAGRIVTTVFMDVKGAFDFVAKNQLLQILFDHGLPLCLIFWVKSFLEFRQLRLCFNGQTEVVDDDEYQDTGIPQGSPFSPILFLIYVSPLFVSRRAMHLSYIDDFSLTVSSWSAEKNIKILQEEVKVLVDLAKEKAIQFDLEKTELIHFTGSRKQLPSIRLPSGDVKEPAKCIRWLGIWFDNRLTFREHIQHRTTQAKQAFYRLMRLANSERGLSPLAVRQVYLACVASIADFGSEVYWKGTAKGQQFILKPLQALQNMAIRKILGAFRTSPVRPMEVEASLPPPAVRLQTKTWKYATRIHRLAPSHPVVKAITRNKVQRPQLEIPKPTQLERIEIAQVNFFSRDIEVIKHFHFRPWTMKLPYTFHIAKLTKDEATTEHNKELAASANQDIINIYSDASSTEEGIGIGVGVAAYNRTPSEETLIGQKCVNIGPNQLVYNGELEGATLGLEMGSRLAQPDYKIKVFADNQASIWRLGKPSDRPGQQWQLRAIKAANTIIRKGATAEIHWVPGHKDILGNEKADTLAKDATKKSPSGSTQSYAMAGMQIKSKIRSLWYKELATYTAKAKRLNPNTYAAKYAWNVSDKMALPPGTPRKVASAFYQLKLGHGHFNSYLHPRGHSETDKCWCGSKQTPKHLLLDCKYHKEERKELKKGLRARLSISILLNTSFGIQKTLDFIKKTGISTRAWRLGEDVYDL